MSSSPALQRRWHIRTDLLIDLLAQGECSVEELANEVDLSIARAPYHLQALRSTHLAASRKEGLYVYFRLADSKVDATIAQGFLDVVSNAVEELTGRKPARIADFLTAHREVLLPSTTVG